MLFFLNGKGFRVPVAKPDSGVSIVHAVNHIFIYCY